MLQNIDSLHLDFNFDFIIRQKNNYSIAGISWQIVWRIVFSPASIKQNLSRMFLIKLFIENLISDH